MNKKSIAEIKKQFKMGNANLTISRIANSYIDHNNVIKFTTLKRFGGIPENEAVIYIENAKKTLGGQIGKALNEYNFPSASYNDGKQQDKLYKLLSSKLEDKGLVEDYISYIIKTLDYKCDYYVTILYCTYSIPNKDKNDEDMEDFSENIFNFLIFSFNFINLTDIGLYYNEQDNIVEKKTNTDYIITSSPVDGFMFPVFNENCADVNSVLYYTKTPKTPNKTMVESLLGCKYLMSAEEEKERFEFILGESLGENINYDTVSAIHSKIRDVIKASENEEETPTLNKTALKKILETSGVKEEDIVTFDSHFSEEIGEATELKAVNLVDASKVNIKSPDVTVTVKASKSDNVEATIIKGKKCLIITLDDNVEVNGLDVEIKK